MKILLISIGVILLLSCNNQEQSSEKGMPVATGDITKCYSYTNKNDTIMLKTKVVSDLVTGDLVYNFYQKDKNTGTIQGQMKGDLLIADYTFNSEGVSSTRQVIFKKDGNRFIEGFGELEDKAGRMIFKHPDSLNFDHTIVLGEVNCTQ